MTERHKETEIMKLHDCHGISRCVKTSKKEDKLKKKKKKKTKREA